MAHPITLVCFTAVLSTTVSFLACAPSSTGVSTGSESGSTSGAASGGGIGSSGTLGAGTGNTGTGVSSGAGASVSGTSPVATSGTMSAGSGSTVTGDSDAGAANDADDILDAPATTDAGTYANWVLSWSDEFNAEAGTKPDPTYWSYDLGGGGWGVGQLQTYTNNAANAETDGLGNLGISAIEDNKGNFTSARIKTQGKFQQAYGRFEIRAKVVTGNGMWPAFWMLGDDFNTAGWPQCGEIDIMEVRGSNPYNTGGSLHGPGYSGMHPLSRSFTLPEGGPTLSDDFHIYAIEWEVGVVRFYVDDTLFETRTPADIPLDAGGPSHWVYDHPFFILINVGIGGMPPWGPPTGTTFPQTMLIDYVRVYERPDAGP
jgi:beta-glucanase (GH16 family)